jgi:DNA-binding XRE family transcriptional regulator
MSVATITKHGKKFALIPMDDYRQLIAEPHLPAYPPLATDYTRNALESIRVSIAHKLIEDRRNAGLTQQQLADLSGVRQETISRIESAQRTLTESTMNKLTKAIRKASSRRLRRA